MKYPRQSGISLLEILITIAIFSILSAVAAPSVHALIQKNRARAIADEFTSSVYQARSESVKRGNRVTLCASDTTQSSCDASAESFSGGWIVFTDYNSNQVLDPASTLFDTTGDGADDSPEEILFVSGIPTGNIEIKTNGAPMRALTYRSNGLLASNRLFSILLRDTASDEQVARIYMNMTGRARQCIGDTTKCP